MSGKEGWLWLARTSEGVGIREFPQYPQFNGRTGEEGEGMASVVHPEEAFPKGHFLTQVLLTAIALFRP